MKDGKPEEHPLNLQRDWHDFGVSETSFVAVSGYLYVTDFARHVLTHMSEVKPGISAWYPKLIMQRYAEAYMYTFPKPNLEALMGAAEALCAVPLGVMEMMHKKARHPFTGSAKLLDRCFEINYVAMLLQMYTVGYHQDIPFDRESRLKKEKTIFKGRDVDSMRNEEKHSDLYYEFGNVWFTDEIAGSEVEWPIGKWLDDHDQSPFIAGKKAENGDERDKKERPGRDAGDPNDEHASTGKYTLANGTVVNGIEARKILDERQKEEKNKKTEL